MSVFPNKRRREGGQCAPHIIFPAQTLLHLTSAAALSLLAMPPPQSHPLDSAAQPSHGYPVDESTAASKAEGKESTASHPPSDKPDPTTTSSPAPKFHPSSSSSGQDAAERGVAAAAPTGSSELAGMIARNLESQAAN